MCRFDVMWSLQFKARERFKSWSVNGKGSRILCCPTSLGSLRTVGDLQWDQGSSDHDPERLLTTHRPLILDPPFFLPVQSLTVD